MLTKRKNKKGSHVGMILSFTIFITVIIFAYGIIGSPFKQPMSKPESLEMVKDNLFNLLEQDVIVLRSYDLLNTTGCIQFETPSNNFDSVDFISVLDDGTEVNSVLSGGDTLLEGGHEFVKVYYQEKGLSDTLNNALAGCTPVPPKSISYEKIITEDAILDTVDRIENDYINLTQDLSTAIDDEINILFKTDSGTTGEETRIEMRTNIYAREYQVNYLSREGEMKSGVLILNLW